MCRSKHVEPLRNTGITNSTPRSHLVGYFYTICIMMHGSMNIKFMNMESRNLRELLYMCGDNHANHNVQPSVCINSLSGGQLDRFF